MLEGAVKFAGTIGGVAVDLNVQVGSDADEFSDWLGTLALDGVAIDVTETDVDIAYGDAIDADAAYEWVASACEARVA